MGQNRFIVKSARPHFSKSTLSFLNWGRRCSGISSSHSVCGRSHSENRARHMLSQRRRMWAPGPVDKNGIRYLVCRIPSMPIRSLQQCRGCRLTWFPQAGAGSACPACGGTKVGGTPELFHAGIALVALGLIGWFLRHGPLSERPAALSAAVVASTPLPGKAEPGNRLYVSSTNTKLKPAKVRPAAMKRTTVKPSKVSKVKRRPKKPKARSNHVQR